MANGTSMHAVAGSRPACLYERVAGRIGKLIEDGTLRPGDRLPSLRTVTRVHGVSLTTSLQAYALLETRGLIEARPQSGYYVRPAVLTPPPDMRPNRVRQTAGPIQIAAVAKRVLTAVNDPRMVGLGAAAPAPEMLPFPKLARMIGPIVRRRVVEASSYVFPPGSLPLRRQIARRVMEWGGGIGPDEIVTTCGGTEALYLALRAVTRQGDLVAVETPGYFGTLMLIESLGCKAIEIPALPGDGLDLPVLARVLERHPVKACVASTNCQNPLGFIMSDEAKRALVRMLACRDVPLIEDDIYGDLHFSDERPRPAKAFDEAGLVLLCSSYSKLLAPGYRVGWVAAGRFHARVADLKLTTTLATPTLPELAVARFLGSGGYVRHLRAMRPACRLLVERMRDAVARQFPPGTRMTNPDGGFLLWIELPDGFDAMRLFEDALAQGVSITPGPIFSPRLDYRRCLRINCAHPWSPTIDDAVSTLGRLANAQRRGPRHVPASHPSHSVR